MKLCIDPGHGMANKSAGVYDPGAVAGGFNEADIVLQWALTGKWVLQQAGLECWLTRDDDSDQAPLADRVHQARQAGCNLYIALHCNAAVDPGATGTETYYRDDIDKQLAAVVQGAALEALYLRDRGLRTEGQSQHARLAVLEFTGPACLVELGFISNPGDRARLLERNRRIKFWEQLVQSLKSWR